jgi:hypothetical protein
MIQRSPWQEIIERECLDIQEEAWFEEYVISHCYTRQADLSALLLLYQAWEPERFSRVV